jgi:hypothetical protein
MYNIAIIIAILILKSIFFYLFIGIEMGLVNKFLIFQNFYLENVSLFDILSPKGETYKNNER